MFVNFLFTVYMEEIQSTQLLSLMFRMKKIMIKYLRKKEKEFSFNELLSKEN